MSSVDRRLDTVTPRQPSCPFADPRPKSVRSRVTGYREAHDSAHVVALYHGKGLSNLGDLELFWEQLAHLTCPLFRRERERNLCSGTYTNLSGERRARVLGF